MYKVLSGAIDFQIAVTTLAVVYGLPIWLVVRWVRRRKARRMAALEAKRYCENADCGNELVFDDEDGMCAYCAEREDVEA